MHIKSLTSVAHSPQLLKEQLGAQSTLGLVSQSLASNLSLGPSGMNIPDSGFSVISVLFLVI